MSFLPALDCTHVVDQFSSVQFSSVTQSCLTLCDPMDCSMPDFLFHHQLTELAQTHVPQVGDAIPPFHPLPSPSPSAFNLSQHQCLFKWVSFSHQLIRDGYKCNNTLAGIGSNSWSPTVAGLPVLPRVCTTICFSIDFASLLCEHYVNYVLSAKTPLLFPHWPSADDHDSSLIKMELSQKPTSNHTHQSASAPTCPSFLLQSWMIQLLSST